MQAPNWNGNGNRKEKRVYRIYSAMVETALHASAPTARIARRRDVRRLCLAYLPGGGSLFAAGVKPQRGGFGA